MKINLNQLRYILFAVLYSITPAYAQQYQSIDFLDEGEASAPQARNQVMMNPEKDIKEKAFKSVKESLSPLSTDQIDELKELYKSINRSSNLENNPPTPTFSSITVDLQPGSAPPAIRLAAGLVSSLVFVDVTGAPWPIRAYDVGDPTNFNIVWNQNGEDETSMTNTLLMQPMSLYKDGNLAVMLQGLNTPVMLSLIPGQKEVDYRVDIQVPGRGPFAKESDSLVKISTNPALNQVINNITPQGSKLLKVKGGAARAWLFGDVMYVRTALPIVSPAWNATMRGAGGTVSAYELPKSPVILVMDNGRIRKLNVEGF
ncbi:DotH/IcmK family type IV secretion protein [Gammaproteobacteria bacterium]|nr:DotH/IcmK family type IV secretion protein [Gammaproteobacteria bacterium]